MPRCSHPGGRSWLDRLAAHLTQTSRTLPKVCGDIEFIIFKAVVFILGIATLGGIVVRILSELSGR
jgi:hypothetical protein